MYAIFENGSKQYRVSEGDTVKLEKLRANVGDTVEFPVVMLSDDDGIKSGAEAAEAKVTAAVVAQGKAKKIIVFRYKPKKNERKKQGHRQPFTEVKIVSIGTKGKEAEKPAKKPRTRKTAAEKAASETAVEAKAE